MKSQALAHGVPVIPNHSFDQSIATVIDLVMERARPRARPLDGEVTGVAGRNEPRTKKEADSMKLFLDTASIEEIREINRWGVLGGVTTNPSLLAQRARRTRQGLAARSSRRLPATSRSR